MSKISNATASEAKEMQKIAKINEASTPNAGTTGEHASCDETLQKGHAHKTQTEFTRKPLVSRFMVTEMEILQITATRRPAKVIRGVSRQTRRKVKANGWINS